MLHCSSCTQGLADDYKTHGACTKCAIHEVVYCPDCEDVGPGLCYLCTYQKNTKEFVPCEHAGSKCTVCKNVLSVRRSRAGRLFHACVRAHKNFHWCDGTCELYEPSIKREKRPVQASRDIRSMFG